MIDDKLLALIKVSELGSFTKAASALMMSQPAISHQIRGLELELNVKLFERTHSELRLTREGSTVLQYAKRMVSLDNQLRRDLAGEANHKSSYIIGITHTAESNAITEAIAMYVDTHHGVSVKIITDTQANLLDRLRTYELDLAIIEGKTESPDLTCLLLDTDSLVLAVSPSDPLTKKTMVTVADLKQQRLILRLPNSGTRSLFDSALESHNISIDDFDIVMEIDNVATIKDLIRRGFGASVLAKSACMDELRKKKLVLLPIENLSMIRENNIVFLKSSPYTGMVNDIIQCYNSTK